MRDCSKGGADDSKPVGAGSGYLCLLCHGRNGGWAIWMGVGYVGGMGSMDGEMGGGMYIGGG